MLREIEVRKQKSQVEVIQIAAGKRMVPDDWWASEEQVVMNRLRHMMRR